MNRKRGFAVAILQINLPHARSGQVIFCRLLRHRVEIVGYDNVQFTKAPNVLRGMGLTHLAKNEKAKKELAEKGMALE